MDECGHMGVVLERALLQLAARHDQLLVQLEGLVEVGCRFLLLGWLSHFGLHFKFN